MTSLTPPLKGQYFPPENEDDPYGLTQFAADSEPAPADDLDALRRRVHGGEP